MVTITQTFNGRKIGINEKVFSKQMKGIMNSIKKAADIIAKEVEEFSKNDYMNKRITDKTPSLIFGSFRIQQAKMYGDKEVKAIVFCGGNQAPYAKYLENDRPLRNGATWGSINPKAPYKFMLAGINHAKEISNRIILQELKKRRT